MILHTILSKMVRQAGCTTLLIVETSIGRETLGLGVEEFVADGVIILRKGEIEGRLVRELEISKMRGTEIRQPRSVFTLDRGFRICAPLSIEFPKERRRFEPIPDTDTNYSTGSRELDEMLGGGYPKGSLWVIERDLTVPYVLQRLIARVAAFNFLQHRRGVIIYPAPSATHEEIDQDYRGFVDHEALQLVRVCEISPRSRHPSVLPIGGAAKDLENDERAWNDAKEESRRKTGKPILMVLSLETLENRYMESKEKLFNMITNQVSSCRVDGDLAIAFSRPRLATGLRALSPAGNLVRLTEKDGAILFYGVNPRTELHAIGLDFSEGYPRLGLTLIT